MADILLLGTVFSFGVLTGGDTRFPTENSPLTHSSPARFQSSPNANVSGLPITPTARRRPTRIEFKVTPGSVVIFLDGRRLGTASKVGTVRSRPGRRRVRLKRGADETEFELELRRGETLRFDYDFGD